MSETDENNAAGYSNPAFEHQEPEVKAQVKPVNPALTEEALVSIQDGPNQCSFFGCFRLPGLFQRLFLRAAWILVFLSWAATIQVRISI